MTTQIQLNLEEKKEVLICEETPKQGKQIIVSDKTLKPKKAVKPKKFILNPKFKTLLKSVVDSKGEEVGKIANAFLNKEFVGVDGLNYIGISEEDDTKISYLDEARILKFEKLKEAYYEIHPTLEVEATINTVRKIYWDSEPEIFNDVVVNQTITGKNAKIRLQGQGTSNKLEHLKVTLDSTSLFSPELNNTDFIFVSDLLVDLPDNTEITFYTESGIPDFKFTVTNKKLVTLNPNTQTTISNFKVKLTKKFFPKVWQGKVRYHSTVGKLIRKIFGQEFTDKEISDFTDAYREFTMIGISGYSYEEVTGEKIRENYHHINYASDTSTLGKSCMRQTEKQGFFKMYEESDCCRLATLYFHKKVAGRCLLWTNESGTFRDRIYSVDETSNAILKNLTNKYADLYNDSTLRKNVFPVKEELVRSLEKAPYMDSLCYYDFNIPGLTGVSPAENYWKFKDQHGNIYKKDKKCCPHCGSNDADLLDTYYDETGCFGCVVDTSRGRMFRDEDDVVYCEYGSWTHAHVEDTITLFNDDFVHDSSYHIAQYENDFGYFLDDIHDFIEEDGLYYHPADEERPSLIQARVEEQTPDVLESIEEEDDAF
jgi:hypothetical protein